MSRPQRPDPHALELGLQQAFAAAAQCNSIRSPIKPPAELKRKSSAEDLTCQARMLERMLLKVKQSGLRLFCKPCLNYS